MSKIYEKPSFETQNAKVQVLFFMDEKLKREFKIYAVKHFTTMSDILNSYVSNLIAKEKRYEE